MNKSKSLSLRFWGTRGSTTPYMSCPKYGIHTTAIEIQASRGRPIFIDLGTGAVPASQLALQNGVREFDILMTHLHIDHICGALSFMPFHRADCRVRISGVHDVETAMQMLISPPFFPLKFADLQAQVEFERAPVRGRKELPERGITVSWGPLVHPQGSTAFRFDDGSNAIVFATDVELGPDIANPDLVKLLSEPYPAALAAFDGFFTEAEMRLHKNWGHSSWREACAIGRETGVNTVLITHHHPKRSDSDLLEMSNSAEDGIWAQEGQIWTVKGNHAEVYQR